MAYNDYLLLSVDIFRSSRIPRGNFKIWKKGKKVPNQKTLKGRQSCRIETPRMEGALLYCASVSEKLQPVS